MQNHTQVLTGLEMEFKRMDRLCALGELHAFGRDTEKIFEELNVIRRKQLDLAADHIALETIGELPQHHDGNGEGYQQSFKKKEMGLKNLMLKLDDLGASMKRFHELSYPDVHSIRGT